MLPNGIAGPLDQSSPISGNMCMSIGQTPNAGKFRRTPTRSVRDIRCRKFLLLEKWTVTKVHQNPLRPAMHQCHHCAKFHRAWPNYVREKRYQKCYTLQYFGSSGGPAGPKFTNLGTDVQQGLG